jgi:hypothetical protein
LFQIYKTQIKYERDEQTSMDVFSIRVQAKD